MDAAARRGVVDQPDDDEEWDKLPAGVGSRSSDDEPWALVGDMPSGPDALRKPCACSGKRDSRLAACSRRCGGRLVASG